MFVIVFFNYDLIVRIGFNKIVLFKFGFILSSNFFFVFV
ncbi:hypothetical protein CP03DC29_1242, partial [Chlamydia psittaci 03DC29]